MGAITKHYNKVKHSLSNISMRDLEVLGTDMSVAALGGLGTVLISGLNKGSLDLDVKGVKVPLDAIGAAVTGLVGYQTSNYYLHYAALGMAGAAGARIAGPHVKKAMGFAGEYDGEASMGWGADGIDPLVESAKYL